MKKVITIVILFLIAIGIGIFCILNTKTRENEKINSDENLVNDTITKNEYNDENKKILVVYFSAQTHTKSVAKRIASNLNADIFEIVPKDVYTQSDLDWTNNSSRVSMEHANESLRNIELKTTKVDNWDNYDTILIGYPIWWGIAAWPVNNFVKDNDFTGKTVIPFCTSASSGLGESGTLLRDMAGTGNWLSGHRFSSEASNTDIKKWTDSLK